MRLNRNDHPFPRRVVNPHTHYPGERVGQYVLWWSSEEALGVLPRPRQGMLKRRTSAKARSAWFTSPVRRHDVSCSMTSPDRAEGASDSIGGDPRN